MKLNTNVKKTFLVTSCLTIFPFWTVFAQEQPLMDIQSTYIEELQIIHNNTNNYINGFVNKDYAYIRKEPSLDSQILVQTIKGQKLEIIGNTNDWFAINFNGGIAYVHSNYVNKYTPFAIDQNRPIIPQQPTFAIIEPENGLFASHSTSSSSEALSNLPTGSIVEVIGSDQDVTRILVGSDIGYVESGLVSIYNGNRQPSPIPNPQPANPKAAEIVSYAMQFLGTPYVWGGIDLINGVDCSGFVYKVMKNNGITINRISRDQALNGTTVNRNELQKADLVFFDTTSTINNGNISHVGLYIGNGYFIHAPASIGTSSPYVRISNLNNPYFDNAYVTATRVLN